MKMKIIAAILLCCVLISCFIFSSNAYDYIRYSLSWSQTNLASSGDDTYLLSLNGSSLLVEKIAPDTFSQSLSLSYPVVSCDVFSSTVCALCNDTDQRQLAVYLYDVNTDYLDSFFIRDQMIWSDIGFSLSDVGLYLLSDNNSRRINRYSYSGKQLFHYTFNADVSCIFQGYGGSTYAVSQHTLFRLTDNAVITVSGASVSEKARFISDDILVDNAGCVYKIAGDTLTQLFSSGSSALSGGVTFGEYYLPFGNTVNRYNKNGEKTGYCVLDDDILAVCSSQNRLIALTDGGGINVNHLYPEDFMTVQSYDFDIVSQGFEHEITSDIYTVDWENHYISDIPFGVSVTKFKNNLSYSGYELHLYQDGVEKTSGECATAMTAVFLGRNQFTFELSVIGDLNANGKVNTADKDALMDYLIHVWSFSGVYLDAADINRDGSIDLLDTVKISQMIAK